MHPEVAANLVNLNELAGLDFDRQAARHGVTPDGRSLDYRPEREPAPEEIRELAVFWLRLAEGHRAIASSMMRDEEPVAPSASGETPSGGWSGPSRDCWPPATTE